MELEIILPLINRIIKKHYGGELVKMVTDGQYIKFIIPNMIEEDGEYTDLFHKNYWGMLWVYDNELVTTIRDIFGFDEEEIKEVLKEYFETKYGVSIKNITIVNDYGD